MKCHLLADVLVRVVLLVALGRERGRDAARGRGRERRWAASAAEIH